MSLRFGPPLVGMLMLPLLAHAQPAANLPPPAEVPFELPAIAVAAPPDLPSRGFVARLTYRFDFLEDFARSDGMQSFAAFLPLYQIPNFLVFGDCRALVLDGIEGNFGTNLGFGARWYD